MPSDADLSKQQHAGPMGILQLSLYPNHHDAANDHVFLMEAHNIYVKAHTHQLGAVSQIVAKIDDSAFTEDVREELIATLNGLLGPLEDFIANPPPLPENLWEELETGNHCWQGKGGSSDWGIEGWAPQAVLINVSHALREMASKLGPQLTANDKMPEVMRKRDEKEIDLNNQQERKVQQSVDTNTKENPVVEHPSCQGRQKTPVRVVEVRRAGREAVARGRPDMLQTQKRDPHLLINNLDGIQLDRCGKSGTEQSLYHQRQRSEAQNEALAQIGENPHGHVTLCFGSSLPHFRIDIGIVNANSEGCGETVVDAVESKPTSRGLIAAIRGTGPGGECCVEGQAVLFQAAR
ncbi:hypothetical protein B0H14DRAFT_2617247 [Mycena olivaceomarginata]|nr:hypothetical protein B0H14DRAFT_2617247 [Mycena olivaceomarginata]